MIQPGFQNRMRGDALEAKLATPQLILGPADLNKLRRMCIEGKSRQVREILEGRAKRIVNFYMRMFSVKLGAPRVQDPVALYLLGIYRKRRGLSYNELARIVNAHKFRDSKRPSGYAVQQAIMRAEKALGKYVPKKKRSQKEATRA